MKYCNSITIYIVLTRASITYHTSIWIQDPEDSVDSVDSYESVRGRIGLYKEVLTLAHCNPVCPKVCRIFSPLP